MCEDRTDGALLQCQSLLLIGATVQVFALLSGDREDRKSERCYSHLWAGIQENITGPAVWVGSMVFLSFTLFRSLLLSLSFLSISAILVSLRAHVYERV